MPKRVITPEQKLARHEWYLRNKERCLIAAKIRYQKNKDSILAKTQVYGKTERAKRLKHARYLKNKELVKERSRKYYTANKSAHRANGIKWAIANAEKVRAQKKAWRAANVEKARESVRRHYLRNPHKKKEAYKRYYDPKKIRDKYHSDPAFKVMRILRSRLRLLLKQKRARKAAPTMTLAGCSLPFLLAHLEARFQPGMTWENHGAGYGKWNVDHIRPCASFDLTDPAQQEACFHFSNLTPLWHEENAKKGAFYVAA